MRLEYCRDRKTHAERRFRRSRMPQTHETWRSDQLTENGPGHEAGLPSFLFKLANKDLDLKAKLEELAQSNEHLKGFEIVKQ